MADEFRESPNAPPTQQVKLPDSVRARTPGMAIVSLILGVVGLVTCLPGIIGLILGIVSLRHIRRSDGKLGGQGVAIAGISVSGGAIIVSGLMTLFMISLMLPAFGMARQAALSAKARTDGQQLAMTMVDYHVNNDSRFPPVDDWRAAMEDDAEAAAEADDGDDTELLFLPVGFSMNAALDGMYAFDVAEPGRTVMFFQTPHGSPLAGGRELLASEPEFDNGYIIVFVDASVDQVPLEMLDDLVWGPAAPE